MEKAPALQKALASGDFASLEAAAGTLNAGAWSALPPLLKLVLFKLLDASRALAFYSELPLPEKLFLFGGFPLSAIAPVLERASAGDRRRFVQLPRGHYEEMYRQLVTASRAVSA